MFGKRLTALVWAALALATVGVAELHASRPVEVFAGLALGMAIVATWMFPSALRPGWITNWERGAWGEQMTASEVNPLRRRGWLVRHDLRWGARGNHDHLLVGPSVYVLNSKYLRDSRITIEGESLRVTRLDNEADSYLADRCVPSAEREARHLKHELTKLADTPVHVYPVIVVWGDFPAGDGWVGDVAGVHGKRLLDWLDGRKTDLLSSERRERVAAAARTLPTASVVGWRDLVRRAFVL